jgi:hypothetical protein
MGGGGARGGAVGWRTELRAGRSKVGIFHWLNYPGRSMALGSAQSLTEIGTRNITWMVKAAGTYGWQLYNLHVPIIWKSWSLNLLEPSGPLQGLLYLFYIEIGEKERRSLTLEATCTSETFVYTLSYPGTLRTNSPAARTSTLRLYRKPFFADVGHLPYNRHIFCYIYETGAEVKVQRFRGLLLVMSSRCLIKHS